MLNAARWRAKKNGLEFTLTKQDIIIPTHGPVLGIPLEITQEGSRSRRCENAPSIDRINNSKGYTPSNIAIISWRANRMKNGWSLDELEQLTTWLRSKI